MVLNYVECLKLSYNVSNVPRGFFFQHSFWDIYLMIVKFLF